MLENRLRWIFLLLMGLLLTSLLSGCGGLETASVELRLDPGTLESAYPGREYTLRVELARQNYAGPVQLLVQVPEGFEANFGQNPVLGNSAELTLRLSPTLDPGRYELRLQAQDLGGHPLDEALLVVFVEAPSLSLTLRPSSLSLAPGESARVALDVRAVNGAFARVHLAAAGTPAGLSVTFDANDFALAAGETKTVNLRLDASSSVTPGTYAFRVQASDGERTLGDASLRVEVSRPALDLSVSPASLSMDPGDVGSVTLTLRSVGGFSGTVTVSCAPSAAEVTCGVAAGVVTLAKDETKTISATVGLSSSARASSYSVQFRAVSGALSDSASVSIAVGDTTGFNVDTPLATVIRLRGQNNRGDAAVDGWGVPIAYFEITRAEGYLAPLYFAIEQVRDPEGVVRPVNALFTEYRFTYNDATTGGNVTTGGSMYLRADIAPQAKLGSWTVTVRAFDPSVGDVQRVSFELEVQNPFLLTFDPEAGMDVLGPNRIALKQGQEGAPAGRVGMTLHPYIVGGSSGTPYTAELEIVAVSKEGLPLTLAGNTGFFSGYTSSGTPVCAVASGVNALDEVNQGLVGVKLGSSCSATVSVTPVITQPIRVQVSPEASVGNYRILIRGSRTPGGYWRVAGSPSDYFGPGGGYVPEQTAWRVPYELAVKVQVEENYLRLTANRDRVTLPEPSSSSTCTYEDVLIEVEAVGDGIRWAYPWMPPSFSGGWYSTTDLSCPNVTSLGKAYRYSAAAVVPPSTETISLGRGYGSLSSSIEMEYVLSFTDAETWMPVWWTGTVRRKVTVQVDAP